MDNVETSVAPKKVKLDFKDSKYATGRRKRSIAKVWVKKGSGNIFVNGIKMDEYNNVGDCDKLDFVCYHNKYDMNQKSYL